MSTYVETTFYTVANLCKLWYTCIYVSFIAYFTYINKFGYTPRKEGMENDL